MSGWLSKERLEEIRARNEMWPCDDIPPLLDYISYLEAQLAFQAETIRGMAVDEAR